MYVGLKMLKEFPVFSPDTLISEADKIMEENKLWMVLVTKNEKLKGYVIKEDVRAALPSPLTTLSRYEINYLLNTLTIKDIIRTDMKTVYPETEIEEAAYIMYKYNLPGLAVVNRKNKLVGYINRSVMLEVLVEEMGLEFGGSRIVIEVKDRPGVIADISTLIADMKISIISTATFFHNDKRMVVFRLDTEDPSPVVEALKQKGYHLPTPDFFKSGWE